MSLEINITGVFSLPHLFKYFFNKKGPIKNDKLDKMKS